MYDPPLQIPTSPTDSITSSAIHTPSSPSPSVTSATSEDGDDVSSAGLGVLSALTGTGRKQKQKRKRKSSELTVVQPNAKGVD